MLTMKEWVQNDLYRELTSMPLWTLSAFGNLKDGDVLSSKDVRYDLICYLVARSMDKAPLEIYDSEYRHTWKVIEFVEPIKFAVRHLNQTRQ